MTLFKLCNVSYDTRFEINLKKLSTRVIVDETRDFLPLRALNRIIRVDTSEVPIILESYQNDF